MAINNPGVRKGKNGTAVIQMAKRSAQMIGIYEAIDKLLPNNGTEPVTLTAQQARTLWGYAQTIGTVGDELKSVGK